MPWRGDDSGTPAPMSNYHRSTTMMTSMVAAVDRLLGLRAVLSGRVTIGSGTRIQWRRVRVPSGNLLAVGNQSLIEARVLFESDGGRIAIGDRTYIGRSSLICHTSIDIGNDVIMSWGITVVDHNSHSINWSKRSTDVADWARGTKNWEQVRRRPVRIGDKVWIGFNASVLMGVTVGEGAVIGAGSVVRRDVPAYCVVAGNPAMVIRELSNDER
ncbi:MAG: acetyltransferase [Gemmatimonadetes bacterium]|nr:acetyltransferase [Gemmatimonadota bacterium]